MKLKEININHYRSFGENAHLKFDSHVMALVGVNGIGKSNVLEAISRMAFFNDKCEKVIPPGAVNKNTRDNPRLRLVMEFSEDEIRALGEKLDCTLQSKTAEYIFEYKSGRTRLRFSGIFCEAMEKQAWFSENGHELHDLANLIKKKGLFQTNVEYAVFCEAISGFSQYYISHFKTALSWMASNVISHSQDRARAQAAANLIKSFSSCLEHCYKVFREFSPAIHLFQDTAEFPDQYDLNAIVSWNQNLDDNQKNALTRFLTAVGSSREELLRAFQEADPSVRNDIQDRIQYDTNKLMEDFNHTFMQDQAGIRLNVKFEGNTLRFTVSNNSIKGSTLWSEASAGVRWYLNAFFELHKAIQSPNAIILVDEPAIHLHVNAQKEVLGLLYQMASEGKYLIYTTHSPFMIDSNRLGDVRAIVRMGDTSAIRPLTTMHVPNCQMDVLAPICHAIGYNLGSNLSPSPNKINIITEGLSDACYIGAMARVLISDATQFPYVLPGQGASKVPNLLAIVLGWGLKYKVVLDNDDEGHRTMATIAENYGEDVEVNVVYVSGEEGFTTENLISKEDYRKACGTDYNPDMPKQAKIAKARQFSGMVDSGELVPDEETRRNFMDLFVQLGLVEKSDLASTTDNSPQETLS